MGRHVFMVITCPPEGEEEAYSQWYIGHHMPDVLKIPGFVGARRYRLAPPAGGGGDGPQFLAIYEIETADVDAVLAELARRAGGGLMPLYSGGKARMVARYVGTADTPHLLPSASGAD